MRVVLPLAALLAFNVALVILGPFSWAVLGTCALWLLANGALVALGKMSLQ